MNKGGLSFPLISIWEPISDEGGNSEFQRHSQYPLNKAPMIANPRRDMQACSSSPPCSTRPAIFTRRQISTLDYCGWHLARNTCGFLDLPETWYYYTCTSVHLTKFSRHKPLHLWNSSTMTIAPKILCWCRRWPRIPPFQYDFSAWWICLKGEDAILFRLEWVHRWFDEIGGETQRQSSTHY